MLVIAIIVSMCVLRSRTEKPVQKTSGTVKPISPFDAAADAVTLYNTLTISGERIKDFKNLVTKRSCDQRAAIKIEYEKKYGPLDNLMPIPADDYVWYTIVKSSFLCNATLYAYQAGKVLGEDHVDIDSISDIMIYCSQTAEMHDLCLSEYRRIYNQELEVMINDFTGHDFKNVLQTMVQTKRAEKINDPHFVNSTVHNLLNGKKSWKNHRHWLDQALISAPLDVSKEILETFEHLNQDKNLAEDIRTYLDSHAETFYLMMYYFVTDQIKYFCDRIIDSMNVDTSMSTNELLLIRNILVTSDLNLVEVSSLFQQIEEVSLKEKLEWALHVSAGIETKTLIFGYLNISCFKTQEKAVL